MSGKRSRNKGSRGELEVRDILRARGIHAGRVPNSGGLDQKGDVVDLPGHSALAQIGIHLEVKRQERLALPQWIEQASQDAGELTPCVVWRRNNEPWFIALPFEAFLDHLGIDDVATEEE
jgi:Holliday junction resolvase